jgi:hypothetical protein
MIIYWPSCLYFKNNIRQQNSCFQSLSHWYKAWGGKHQLWARNNSDVPSMSFARVRLTFSCAHAQMKHWLINLILRGRQAYHTVYICVSHPTHCRLYFMQPNKLANLKPEIPTNVMWHPIFSLSVLSGKDLQIYKLSSTNQSTSKTFIVSNYPHLTTH